MLQSHLITDNGLDISTIEYVELDDEEEEVEVDA